MEGTKDVVCCPECGDEKIIRFKTAPCILCQKCKKIIRLESKP